jgi:putative FmdB family regulatory protein
MAPFFPLLLETNYVAFDAPRAIPYLLTMPIYEFHCGKCGADSEVLVRSSHWEGTACPKCGSKRLAKKMSRFASAGSEESSEAASCTGTPSSCGLCGTGRPHSH